MPGPTDVLWEFVSNLSQHTAAHIGKRMDKAAGLTPPPMPAYQPPPFPGMAAMPGLPTIPAIPAMPAIPGWAPMAMGTGAATGGAVAVMDPPQTEPSTAHADPDSTDSRDTVTGSYSDQVAQGIACLACTRGHISGVLAAVEEAQSALEAGDEDKARAKYAMAAAEIDAMVAIDWHPDKLAATPKEDVAVIEAVRECILEIREQLPTPKAAALALGSGKENVRFAVSPTFTENDRREINERIRIIDKQGNGLERGDLLMADGADYETASTELREARHVLDGAQTDGSLYKVSTHKEALQHLEAAAAALTPTPTGDQIEAVASLCQTCSDTFYGAYFTAMANRESE